ncbi:hypothetical protein ODJ79_06655 [Actinoplanes sp. KI2]|uniref:hypothetical protein n=1 Tax=Actinoplanes sp. KI2 TaxID=2983315 RepID=UPI0021D5E6E9|nr:hypothetical protein [Actinoplanes sp. KI2]MCU7723386.1 hypothetical protein [Actinoplanes sp. KI2]
MRLGLALSGVAAVALVGGCTAHSGSPTFHGADSTAPSAPAAAGSAPPFTEPASYTFTLTHGCDDASPLGRYRVAVRSGAVTSSQRIGGSAAPSTATSSDADLGPVNGQNGEEIDVPTLAGLRDMAQTATDDGGQVTTTYDGTDGHPVKVIINVSDEGPSGDDCWSVTDYAPAS